jgi:hypothetical protein
MTWQSALAYANNKFWEEALTSPFSWLFKPMPWEYHELLKLG